MESKENPGPFHPAPIEFSAAEIGQDPLLRFFHYAHLPPALRPVSEAACTLARAMVDTVPRNAERTAGLRKLLEAKDCFVRANLPS